MRAGGLISYEEYSPYGNTTYQAGQCRRGEPEALSLYGQGAGRGERVHLSRGAILCAVVGEVDGSAIRPESRGDKTSMPMPM